jgi:CheY-like chemotaxis protein
MSTLGTMGEPRGGRAASGCPVCGGRFQPGQGRYRVDAGDVHVDCLPGLRGRTAAVVPTSQALLTGVIALVVEDNGDSRDFFAYALQHCGATVHVAGSVREALDTAARAAPDVVISDLSMADADGYALVAGLGAQGRRPPTVAVTAFPASYSRDRSLQAGFDAFLTKPVDPDELCDAVRKVLDAREPGAA